MGIYQKSTLLSLLRKRLEQDRTKDWQSLHVRDRGWYLKQPVKTRWPLQRAWLSAFGEIDTGPLPLLLLIINVTGLIAGFSLIAGLVEFQTLERINLLWFLLLALLLPVLWWITGLMIAGRSNRFPLQSIFQHRLPQWMDNPTLYPLLRRTAMLVSQQFSLLFAIGMILALLLYILVTDLAFGWSSTLDLSPQMLLHITDVISWPWQQLWPEAVPTLALIEQTHYYRSAPMVTEQVIVLGQWWRFLLMSLLLYVLLPRLLSYSWFRVQLAIMQIRMLENDALISGLWQRMTTEAINQEAEQVEQLQTIEEAAFDTAPLPACRHILRWGSWPEAEWNRVEKQLRTELPQAQIHLLEESGEIDAVVVASVDILLICKGWEPPMGELADTCQQLSQPQTQRFIWPVPLSGMSEQRIEQLNHSWRAFMPHLPDGFHLLSGERHA